MKLLILIGLIITNSAFSQQRNTSDSDSPHITLDKSAINELTQKKNQENDKYTERYNYHQSGDILVCESRGNRRSYCSADTSYGVQFVRQLSRSSCDYNWGYDERGIWVDNGCRAEFSVNHNWDAPDSYGNLIVCESHGYDRNYCRVRLDRREVILVRQISRSSCYNNWGYDYGGIWVTNGCRAEFALEDRFDNQRGELTCSSVNGQFRMCRANTRGGVEFIRQLSRASCNYNWGYDERGVWVTNGCRARFKILPSYGFNDRYEPKKVYCSSNDFRQKFCNIPPHNGVEFLEQRSRASCEGNWGFDRNKIWVTNGCRATFAVYEKQYQNDDFYNDDYRNDNYRERDRDPYGYQSNQVIICESNGYRTNSCPIPRRSKVRLSKQLSKSSCRGNWSYNNREVIVKNGCRAEFEIYNR